MRSDAPLILLLSFGAVLGYLVVMFSQPTRSSFRDGWRCVVRYKRLCAIPFVFAGCHAAFALFIRYTEAGIHASTTPLLFPWTGCHPPGWREVLAASWLPAAESLASIFSCTVTTFPLSALCGVLFLINWRGYQMLLSRGLRRRFGVFFGVAVQTAMLFCALAACVKPVLFGRFVWLNQMAEDSSLMSVGEGVNWLSFLFEYVVGVGVQIYLLLIAFAWIRGLTFDSEALRRFALRRWVLVLQWAGVLLLISSFGINLPLLLNNFARVRGEIIPSVPVLIAVTRWILAAGLVLFSSIQLCLVFHNGTIWRAFVEHFQLLRRYAWQIGWFTLVAAVHFMVLAASNVFVPQILGEWTWPAVCWKTLLYPFFWALLSAWALAAWVCLFRRCEAGRPEAADLVTF